MTTRKHRSPLVPRPDLDLTPHERLVMALTNILPDDPREQYLENFVRAARCTTGPIRPTGSFGVPPSIVTRVAKGGFAYRVTVAFALERVR
jgi:hypothetical protein